MDVENNCKNYLAKKLDCHKLLEDYMDGSMCSLILEDGTIGGYDLADRYKVEIENG